MSWKMIFWEIYSRPIALLILFGLHCFIANSLKLDGVGAEDSLFYLKGVKFWDVSRINTQSHIKNRVNNATKSYGHSVRMKICVFEMFEDNLSTRNISFIFISK